MRRRLIRPVGNAALFIIMGASGAGPATAQAARDSLKTVATAKGRILQKWLVAGYADSVAAEMTPDFLATVGGVAGFAKFADRVKQLGAELTPSEEVVYVDGGVADYARVSAFELSGGQSMTSHWAFRLNDWKLVGASVTPTPKPAPTEFLEYQTKTKLTLPFDGEWYVAWGGRTPLQNYHVVSADQRFAYDFLMLNGPSHSGDGTRNEDYFCFGKPIYAPAAGVVTESVDSVEDNVPGKMNARQAAGNHIVIDHGNGEYSLLAHFRRGSVLVHVGDKVANRQQVGVCGNSGNSSEPHLHYHLQTGPGFKNGVGLPAFFSDYTADGRKVTRGEPLRGERIRR